tara:strand:- start:15 stop:227 length:213 start_codon:yes stop_codon:yes gene_type:complete
MKVKDKVMCKFRIVTPLASKVTGSAILNLWIEVTHYEELQEVVIHRELVSGWQSGTSAVSLQLLFKLLWT